MASHLLFIGTHASTDTPSKEIYAVWLDTVTGAFDEPSVAAAIPNPTFLAWHPFKPFLYASGEGIDSAGRISGGAVGFAFDCTASTLTRLNARGTGAEGTTHLAVDGTGKVLVTVSYRGGQVSVLPIEADGRLGPCTSLLSTTGSLGPNAQRQDKAHPHSVTFSPDNRHVYVCDLGLDNVSCYRLNQAAATLTATAAFPTPAGAGPRHSKFSADGRYLFVVNELSSSLTSYACDSITGRLTPCATVSTLPANFRGTNLCAELRIHPNGKFIYISNRGHDSLAVCAIGNSGALRLVEIVSASGRHPRNFNLSPDGDCLVCANRDSNNLVSFKIDQSSGKLTPTGYIANIPQAVCVLFTPTAFRGTGGKFLHNSRA